MWLPFRSAADAKGPDDAVGQHCAAPQSTPPRYRSASSSNLCSACTRELYTSQCTLLLESKSLCAKSRRAGRPENLLERALASPIDQSFSSPTEMRLINATTFELEEFPDERSLRYAILSHRWEQGEVLLRHMSSKDASRSAKTMKCFYKIEVLVLPRPHDFSWLTCVILLFRPSR